jgi:hypothetical protein
MYSKFIQKSRNSIKLWEKVALAIFFLNFFLVFQHFLPNLAEINAWDEADYVHFGKFFVEGQWPPLSWSPLSALFYGSFYFFLEETPFWFLTSITAGRVTMFVLLWLAIYLVAKELTNIINPLIVIGITFISPLFIDILSNPSDGFFAAISCFAFWQLLSFYNRRKKSHIVGLSIFIGLAGLLRNDGLILIISIFPIIFFLAKTSRIPTLSWLPNLTLPFLIIVGGYILLFWVVRGTFEIGTGTRSYIAFVQGHELVYIKEEDCPFSNLKCAVLDANSKFGSAEENNHSIIRAISNNPSAFAPRLITIVQTLPQRFFDAYGRQLSYIILFFCMLGIFSLIKSRQYTILLISIFWVAYLGVYFLTFFRPGYLQTPFFIVFIFSALGVNFFAKSVHTQKSFLTIFIMLLAIIVGGIIFKIPSIYFNFSILLLTTVCLKILNNEQSLSKQLQTISSLFLILVASMIIRDSYYPIIVGREFAKTPEEQALVVMQENFSKNSHMAAGARGVVNAANMRYFALGNENITADSPQSLHEQLKNANVRGIYVDHHLSSHNKSIWALIEPEIGTLYEILYSGRSGSILVLKVSD